MLAPSGERAPVKREYYCPEDGKALAREQIVRGYALDEKLVPITDEELEQLAPRSSRDIDLQQFVDHAAIDPVYFRRAYYLIPSESAKAYRLLADTMERTGRAGIARFVMRDIEYLVAIFAENGILRAETLRFGDELRDPEAIPVGTARPDAKLRGRVAKALAALAADELDEGELVDVAAERRRARASAKRARRRDVIAVAEAPEDGGQVIDMMKLLKERMAPAR